MQLNRRRALMASLGLLSLCGLAACETDKIDYRPTYGSQPAITLNAGNVQQTDARQPPAQSNFIDDRRGNELADETKRWLAVRVRAGGGADQARVEIRQASVTERLIPNRSSGFFGWMGNAPTYALDGNLEVRIVILDPSGQEKASASAHVGRERSVGQRASVVERDNEARRLMADLIQDLEPYLKQAVRQNLGQFATVSATEAPAVANNGGTGSATGTSAPANTGSSAMGSGSAAPTANGTPYPPAGGGDVIQSQPLPSL